MTADSGQLPAPTRAAAVRIRPGSRSEIGLLNTLLASTSGRAVGTEPLKLFTTMARHRRLFRGWLRFAAALTLRGKLPRVDAELVILRVAANCGSAYEQRHHERIARASGLSSAQISALEQRADAHPWTPRQLALLNAVDELHRTRMLTDAAWHAAAGHLDHVQLVELCMLVGHYEMLAMLLNSAGVQPDDVRGSLLIQRALARRARSTSNAR
jgi:alkylhydroperoxidase family enzyme